MTIKIKDTEVGLLNITDENKTYTIDDLIELNNNEEKSHTLKINKSTNTIEDTSASLTAIETPFFRLSKNLSTKITPY